jgi:magnesium-transporting ATPase (P-type)
MIFAQEASDIVIMDDNFSSIVKSVLWGRSVYDNIRRFLQFQMTVNVSALMICMTGSIFGFGTPLTPIQLLWVNLIMDTLAALALATELPTPDMLLRKPYGRNDYLINGHMWRNLLVQSLYQVVFLMVLLLATPRPILLYDCIPKGSYAQTNDCMLLRPDGTGHNAAENYRNTIIYNAFVWAQLFNEINSRKIYNELNAFDGVMTNSMFVGVVVISSILQFISVQFIPAGFNTVPLDGVAWGISLILGFLSIPIGMLARFLPPFDFVNRLIGGGGGDGAKITPVNQ